MSRVQIMIIMAILGVLVALAIRNYMPASVPPQVLPQEQEAIVEELPVVKEPNTAPTPTPQPTPQKQQVIPQPKPTPVRVNISGEAWYYETTGN